MRPLKKRTKVKETQNEGMNFPPHQSQTKYPSFPRGGGRGEKPQKKSSREKTDSDMSISSSSSNSFSSTQIAASMDAVVVLSSDPDVTVTAAKSKSQSSITTNKHVHNPNMVDQNYSKIENVPDLTSSIANNPNHGTRESSNDNNTNEMVTDSTSLSLETTLVQTQEVNTKFFKELQSLRETRGDFLKSNRPTDTLANDFISFDALDFDNENSNQKPDHGDDDGYVLDEGDEEDYEPGEIPFYGKSLVAHQEKSVSHKRKRDSFGDWDDSDDYSYGNQKQQFAPRYQSINILTPLPSPPWSDNRGAYPQDPLKLLDRELKDYLVYMSPSEGEHFMRKLVVEQVTFAVHQEYSYAQVQAFGSFDTKLYLPSSDIDIVIMDTSAKLPFCLRRVANVLKRHKMVSCIEVIEKSKVPIIKFIDNYTQFKVDLSFNVMNGISSAQIVKKYIKDKEIGPLVKMMMLVIKKFLVQRHLNEVYSGGLGSYSLLVMIVSFLKMHPLVQSNQLDMTENYGVLLIEFLEFYGKTLNYTQVGVGITENGEAFLFPKRSSNFYRPDKPGSLCLQDPQDETNDVSRGSFAIHLVRQEFGRAFTRLTSMIGEYHKNVEDYKHEKRHFERFSDKSFDNNRRKGFWNKAPVKPSKIKTLLGAILTISRQVMEHRDFIETQYKELHEKSKGFSTTINIYGFDSNAPAPDSPQSQESNISYVVHESEDVDSDITQDDDDGLDRHDDESIMISSTNYTIDDAINEYKNTLADSDNEFSDDDDEETSSNQDVISVSSDGHNSGDEDMDPTHYYQITT